MMKKHCFFCLFFSIGLTCFSQEITVTSLVPDGNIGLFDGNGNWPSNTVKSRWDNLFDRFNLVRLQDDDPFNPNELVQRIGSTVWNAVKAEDFFYFHGGKASTVYLTMGNRRFICLLYNDRGLDSDRYWFWVYEVNA